MSGRWASGSAALLASSLACPALADDEAPRFGASLDVARILTEVRVVHPDGHPELGLGADDFQVRVGGFPVEVESARWVAGAPLVEPGEAVPVQLQGVSTAGDVALAPVDRRIVLLFQIDFDPTRMFGLYRMTHRAKRMLDDFADTDQIAVAVYRSHLQLHVDFTTDHELVRREIGVIQLGETKRAARSDSQTSLVATFDFERGDEASTFEKGLETLGDALRPIPGPKSIVLFGYGLGRFSMGTVVLTKDYDRARNALIAAQAAVFAMDVTNAESHSLEGGLRTVAAQTGGFYAKTHLFPGLAMRRLNYALEGHYELTLVRPPALEGVHAVEVEVPTKGVTVLARPVSL